MKEIIVENVHKMSGTLTNIGNAQFTVKQIINNVDKCSINFVEIEPGNFAYSYHYHEENEEAFYIISGEALVKTEEGDKYLTAGDIICFPANIKGSHVIYNNSKTEKLVYIDYGTMNLPDVIHFPNTHTGMTVTKDGVYDIVDE